MHGKRAGRRPDRYDLIVVGGAVGGCAVALGAAERGLRVAVVAGEGLGGICHDAGSHPAYALMRAAGLLHLARTADRFGVTIEGTRVGWPDVRRRVDEVIATVGGDGPDAMDDAGVDLIEATARFLSENELLAGDHVLAADRFVIATGNTLRVPPIEGLGVSGYLTAEEVVALDGLPASLAIVGAGVVAVELAQIFARFGVEITIIGSAGQVLPKEEAELATALAGILEREGVDIRLQTRVEKAARRKSGRVALTCSSPSGTTSIEADEVLLATGRRPNVDRLGLDLAGIAYGPQGIQVDSTLATSVPHIWAVGDVTGIYPLAHVADYQARIALHNLLGEEPPRQADYRVVPWATFTDPELARVGLTEAEAKAGGYAVATATTLFADLPRAIAADARDGMVKLVVDRATHQVIGGHILGAGAGELIAEIALVMRHRLPVSAIGETIHVYPTMAEAIFWTAHDLTTDVLSDSTPVGLR